MPHDGSDNEMFNDSIRPSRLTVTLGLNAHTRSVMSAWGEGVRSEKTRGGGIFHDNGISK